MFERQGWLCPASSWDNTCKGDVCTSAVTLTWDVVSFLSSDNHIMVAWLAVTVHGYFQRKKLFGKALSKCPKFKCPWNKTYSKLLH